MKIIKITPEMAANFKAARTNSQEPTFSAVYNGTHEHGLKAIVVTEQAVFIHQSSFLFCGGFWMPKNTYLNVLRAINERGNIVNFKGLGDINYNNTYYQY